MEIEYLLLIAFLIGYGLGFWAAWFLYVSEKLTHSLGERDKGGRP